MPGSLKLGEKCSVAWSFMNACVTDSYRHHYRENIVVKTRSGPVKGFKIASSFDYEYFNFHGIPYAKPPIGELRFKDPQPIEPSDKVINKKCRRRGSMACQAALVSEQPIGGEDCLHLSVYTHDVKPNTFKPVMVWIHGGAFNIGTNSKDFFSPECLMRSKIVFISINYRLGAFGFLTFKDPELGIPGNAGIKDQVMALKWINENCMHFGGDPNNITVFGESAGAASISLHMISDLSKGLFHKAIMMSGNTYGPWVKSSITNWTERVAKKLGWNGKGGEKACLGVLQRASPHAIVRAQESILTWEDRERHTYFPFGPVLEPYESAQCLLNKDPNELMRSSWGQNIPIITGFCSEEGLLAYKIIMERPHLIPQIKLEYALPYHEFNVQPDSVQCQEMAKRLKKFYFGYSSLSIETLMVYLMVISDAQFIHPNHRLVLSRAKNENAPTYVLRFNFESNYSLTKKLFAYQHIPGVCHGDDFAFYLPSSFVGPYPSKDSDDWRTIERMCDSFVAFARTGNPNNASIAPIQWEPVTLEDDDHKYKCLNVSKKVSCIDLPEYDRCLYWDGIYEAANQHIL